jgi:hypothetical protein
LIHYAIVKPTGKTWNGKFMPATVVIADHPQSKPGKGQAIPVLLPWRNNYKAIQSDGSYRWLIETIDTMLVNSKYTPPEDPKAESITCEGNFISYDPANTVESSLRLECFAHDEDPAAITGGGPLKINWWTRPELYQKAIATDGRGNYINPANGRDVFFALMRRDPPLFDLVKKRWTGGLWMNFEQVELFPSLPCKVRVSATAGPLPIHTSFDGGSPLIDGTGLEQCYAAGESITVDEYRPRGACVWGRTDRGWICLLVATRPAERIFTTDWQLSSPGVIPAVPAG